MSRELLIMRHGESGWDAASDFERTLTVRGTSDAARMGQWIKDQGIMPDYVLASPAQRAKETVLAVCAVLQIDHQQIHWEPSIYEASVNALKTLLQVVPASAERILLVGHNPGLAELIGVLSDGYPAGFSPASVAWMEQGEGRVILRQLVRP